MAEFFQAPLEFWIVGLNFTAVYVALLLALNFFVTGVKKRQVLFGRVNFAIGFTFLFVALHFTSKLVWNAPFFLDIYFPDKAVLGAATALACIGIVEPTIRRQRSRGFRSWIWNHFFTIMAAIDLFLFIAFDSDTPFYIIDLLWIGWDLGFLVQFSSFLRHNTTGGTRQRYWLMIISATFIIAGVLLTLYRVQAIDETLVLLTTGYTCLFIGLVGMYAAFYHSNLFIESGWRDALEALYIIHGKLYQPLYFQDLKLGATTSEEKVSFFSQGLVGIDIILKSITQSNSGGKSRVSLISQEGKFLYIEHSFNAIVCFVANRNLQTLRYYLQQIRDAWDTYYSSRPINWASAQQEVFGAMQVLVNRILLGGGGK